MLTIRAKTAILTSTPSVQFVFVSESKRVVLPGADVQNTLPLEEEDFLRLQDLLHRLTLTTLVVGLVTPGIQLGLACPALRDAIGDRE